MNTTLVCFAVKEEAKFFDPIVRARKDLRLLLTGMGPRNAERAISVALQRERPNLVLSAGFAGGLRPGLPGGAVVFALDHELRIIYCNDRYLEIYGLERSDLPPGMTGKELLGLRRERGTLDCSVTLAAGCSTVRLPRQTP